MSILEEIRRTIALFDPELAKNEDEDDAGKGSDLSIDNYQNAIDSAADPEDLNFSMSNLFDGEDEEEEIEHFEIPQKDFDEEPIKAGDMVHKAGRLDRTGEVLLVGELVEVQWSPELTTLEYPEELIHANDEEELDKVHSLETNPPIPLENDGIEI